MSFIKKVIKKLRKGAWFPFYNNFYERLILDEELVLFESRGGRALEGNILRILMEMEKLPYEKFHRVLVVNKDMKEAVQQKVQFYGIRHIKYVKAGSISYYYYLSKAKYLVNDTSFPGRFIKKDGQVYLNTWHGTPLKKMGRDNAAEMYSMGNVMRNLLMSDYLLFPNHYMEEKMTKAYMLDNLYDGKVLREGYPRNSIFFYPKAGQQLKQKLGYENKTLIAYMPTFRGAVDNIRNRREVLKEHLAYLEDNLKENCQILVKLHPLEEYGIDIGQYQKIAVMPSQYDTYEILNACDVLITDYSSVFYDFANTGKKILLFVYDKEEYGKERGIYENPESYPFEKAETIEELTEALKKPEKKIPKEFQQKYCTWDNKDAAERICRHIFLGESLLKEEHIEKNGKENILIYAGDLCKNGITTALLSMLKEIDKSRFNYYVSFRKSSVEKEPERIALIPDGYGILPIASEMNMDILTIVVKLLYLKTGLKWKCLERRLDRCYEREWKKHFGNLSFRHVIHYNGYETYITALIQRFSGKKTIWVHNDMQQEIREKGNQNRYQLRDAYQSYQNVVVVSEDIAQSVYEISGKQDNIRVIGNIHDYNQVARRAQEDISYSSDTQATITCEELKQLLNEKKEVFINIGRFSVEKGHFRLIDAFNRYWEQAKDTYLIIIGGTGELYEKTVEYAAASKAGQNIILIKSLVNPMPILQRSSLFILSSLYEGLGLVILEADTLHVPVISCNVNGPRGFMTKYGGTLVEDSEEGIFHGMCSYKKGNVRTLNVDYEEMNRINIRRCEEIM